MDLSSVKKAVTGSLWSVCSDCLKERNIHEGEPAGAHDILVCLKCGFQVRSSPSAAVMYCYNVGSFVSVQRQVVSGIFAFHKC